ncbi:unnamed protein product [Closterium sp. NIES-54]
MSPLPHHCLPIPTIAYHCPQQPTNYPPLPTAHFLHSGLEDFLLLHARLVAEHLVQQLVLLVEEGRDERAETRGRKWHEKGGLEDFLLLHARLVAERLVEQLVLLGGIREGKKGGKGRGGGGGEDKGRVFVGKVYGGKGPGEGKWEKGVGVCLKRLKASKAVLRNARAVGKSCQGSSENHQGSLRTTEAVVRSSAAGPVSVGTTVTAPQGWDDVTGRDREDRDLPIPAAGADETKNCSGVKG